VDAILVPLDGSRFAERALPVASRPAQRLEADIHLLSAVAKEDDVVHRAAELAEIELPATWCWLSPSRGGEPQAA